MRLGEGVEWSLHACSLLAVVPTGTALPAGRLAEYHGVPPAYLAKHLQALAQAGIVESLKGRNGGYRLARPPDQITFWDVVSAIEGNERSFRCSEIRQRGPAAVAASQYDPVCGIARVMYGAESAWRRALQESTIQDAVDAAIAGAPPEAGAKALRWLQEVLS